MAVGNDEIANFADFTVDNYAVPMLKFLQREACSAHDSKDIDTFSTLEFLVHKALMSFPNDSSACLDITLPQVLKNVSAKSNGQVGLNFLAARKNFGKCDSRRKRSFRT